ncbi:class I SAM-dependent methyltransferase [Chitinophaga vietnamensis]|uniref:class I SAM-dependent methyltransferase n=1 Tax=Chitinophaga vietnamensis TaxID=2593957 RepID=UPI00191C6BF7|nr:class I SAM-dependent methyltransferase [Chitinophaga vietnamensis]
MTSSQKTNYGIDAPNVIRNLFIIGAILFIIPFFFPYIYVSWMIFPGIIFILEAILMLAYSLYGKFAHRDRMLNKISWKGNEQVLDVGTGKGLLMIGAAKRLRTGKSIGIDIWNAEDLTGNHQQNAWKNATIEGVAEKIDIRNENVMKMNFADNTFDVILSNLCLHNIYNKEGRRTACEEISRVLKPGGTGIISDFRHGKEYKDNFEALGLQTTAYRPNYFSTFPPLRILVIKKL